MQGWWVVSAWEQSPVFLAAWVFWVIFGICLHELGHGWAAISQGDRTPIETGHMTWNPLVHMGPTSLLLFALFGFCWGLMPVNPSRFRSRYGEAIVAGAGPLMNVLLVAVCLAGLLGWKFLATGKSIDPDRLTTLFIFLSVGVERNVLAVMFNMIPVPPLDGSHIVSNFVPAYRRLFDGVQGNIAAMIAFMLVFFVLSRHVYTATWWVTERLIDLVV